MRSRNGNRSISLSICSIIFFSSLALNAGEYLISYRYVVKDAILYNESLSVAKAMKKCDGIQQTALELETNSSSDLKKIIIENSDEFIDYIHKLGMQVKHNDITTNAQYKSTTILTLKTTCFKVDFNDNFAKIIPLK
ncbi:MAG: hypothetical protein NTW78_06690 [Campylobacterales bacterium]|nr:hypothetical protein [Campylobacterales bacterium]